jgi:acyl dehydratase
VIEHSLGRTITEMDNVLFSALTMNTQPLHINEDYARNIRSLAGASSTASSRWGWLSASPCRS